MNVHNADVLRCRLVVVRRTQVLTGDDGVTLAVFFAIRFENRFEVGTRFAGTLRGDRKVEFLLLAALAELDGELRWIQLPALRDAKSEGEILASGDGILDVSM